MAFILSSFTIFALSPIADTLYWPTSVFLPFKKSNQNNKADGSSKINLDQYYTCKKSSNG